MFAFILEPAKTDELVSSYYDDINKDCCSIISVSHFY